MNRLLRHPDVPAVCVLWLALLPFRESISLVLGHPLRVMATTLSVGILNLLGSAVTCELTTIHAAGADIAITDACSGIDELLALIFVGYLYARFRQKSFGWALFAWLFVLPSVIVANMVRLVVLVLLYEAWGSGVLEGAWHVGLGWVQVVLAMVLAWGVGEIVRKVA